jgi:ferredoxin
MNLMSKESKPSKHEDANALRLLSKTSGRNIQKRRKELLAPLDIQEFFAEGTITINKRTCRGIECNLCVKACPTNALYWKAGEIGMTAELCIFCGACVLNCIVDDCVRISRKRMNGHVESFSAPKDFMMLQHRINAEKRFKLILEVFSMAEGYVKQRRRRRHGKINR